MSQRGTQCGDFTRGLSAQCGDVYDIGEERRRTIIAAGGVTQSGLGAYRYCEFETSQECSCYITTSDLFADIRI